VLASELKKKPRGTIGLSTVTDPYQPLEKKYQITRYCLEQLLRYDLPLCVQTKSSLVTRDIDLLKQFSSVEVMMSIGTLNDDERRIMEPSASSINDRLDALNIIADAGVKTSIFFGPIYPTITTEDIAKILDTFHQHQVHNIMIDQLNIKPGIIQNIHSIAPSHPLDVSFSRSQEENTLWYRNIRHMIHQCGKEREMKVTDAF
jgi:DNA repair photolyase